MGRKLSKGCVSCFFAPSGCVEWMLKDVFYYCLVFSIVILQKRSCRKRRSARRRERSDPHEAGGVIKTKNFLSGPKQDHVKESQKILGRRKCI